MDNNWLFIGFDLRVSNCNGSPISADPLVFGWPSYFDRSKVKKNSLNLLTTTDKILFSEDKENKSEIIGISVNSSVLKALISRYDDESLIHSRSVSDLTSREWIFYGYDICDLRGLISGIRGCGDISRHENYLNKLNSNSLFDDVFYALEFAEVRSIEIPNHAPFVVVGIYLHLRTDFSKEVVVTDNSINLI